MQNVLNVTAGNMLGVFHPDPWVNGYTFYCFIQLTYKGPLSCPIEESCDEEEETTRSLPNSLLSECGFALPLLGKIIVANRVLFNTSEILIIWTLGRFS